MSKVARLLTALVLVGAACALLTPIASARVPYGFFGVMADGPIAYPDFDPAAEMDTMVASGVESARVVFHWADAQRSSSAPPSFERFDILVGNAATRGIRVLPVVTTAPPWAAKYPGEFSSPPAGTEAYAAFMGALVARYGPDGTFWAENPAVAPRPIRIWQIWNEPNLRSSWSDRDWAAPYVELLAAARRSVRAADPGARIVLAGLANLSWRGLAAVYRVPGSRGLFDQVAIHPYTREVTGIRTILRLARRTMERNGDRRKALVVTEFGWPSAKGRAKGFGIETTERGQARRVAAALSLLARERRSLRLSAVYWHNWVSTHRGSGSIWPYSGLRRFERDGRVTSKPALSSFRRTALRLEACRRKSSVATRCARR